MKTDEEIKLTLNDAQLAIFEGRASMPEYKRQQYIARWRGEELPPNPTPQTTFACPQLGSLTGEIVGCRTCQNAKEEVYTCGIHGECTIHRPATKLGVACCKYCDDNPANIAEKERAARERSVRSLAVVVIAPPTKVAPDADGFLKSLWPYPAGRHWGRGITIAAGGKYWASAYVTIRMLRHVGCTLPIQVWYLGASGERDERYEELLAPFGVEFVDIDTHPARAERRIVKGFGCKLFAAVHSPFEEVLSLDPDCYSCTDPTVLFDVPEYKRLGGIYWPDGEQTDKWTQWEFWGVAKRGPCGLETGLYVLDKRLAWEPMMLAEFWDDHQDWCYGGAGGQGGGDYGDKGPHRAAWAKLERDYVVFNPVPGYMPGLGFVQAGPDGKTPMFIHRCHNKWHVEGEHRYVTTPQHDEPNALHGLPGEEAAFGFLEELRAALTGARHDAPTPLTA